MREDGITRVRVDGHSAEHQAEDAKTPARVDVWHGVTWMGQWFWIPETGIADQRQKAGGVGEVSPVVLGKIASALRAKGV